MIVLTVDLAAKFSAVCVGDGNEVYREFDSRKLTPLNFAKAIRLAAVKYAVDVIVIEDVPYGISNQAMTKAVTRLQGWIMRELAEEEGLLDITVFLNPATWQREFPGVANVPRDIAKGMTKTQKDAYRIEAARVHAADRGYAPPNLVAKFTAEQPAGKRILKKDTAPLIKNMTDYIDAFLMKEWTLNYTSVEALLKVPGVQAPLL